MLIFVLLLVIGSYVNSFNNVDAGELANYGIILNTADGLVFDFSLAFEEQNVSATVYFLIITALLILIFMVIYLLIHERKSHGVIGR